MLGDLLLVLPILITLWVIHLFRSGLLAACSTAAARFKPAKRDGVLEGAAGEWRQGKKGKIAEVVSDYSAE